MEDASDRLTTLEMRVAEQDRVIEELSGEIAEQWKAIERFRRQAERLAERFVSLEEALPAPAAAPPPHW